MEKLLAPNKSMSLNVILYPLDPPVIAKPNVSILKGSTGGSSISLIPKQKPLQFDFDNNNHLFKKQ